MSFKVNKVIYLLLGTVLGFFVGGGIIWWQMNNNDFADFFRKDKYGRSIDTNQYDRAIRPDKKSDKNYRIGNVENQYTINDSLNMDSINLSQHELLAVYGNEQKDSTQRSSGSSYDDIYISKDELIITRLIKISGEVPEIDNGYELDSILTDQRQTSRKQKGVIKTEFWKSPLNYKGYKFNENKLVIFGFYEVNKLFIVGYNNELFIKYNENYYLIEYTDNFKSFVLMKNETLLKELNAR